MYRVYRPRRTLSGCAADPIIHLSGPSTLNWELHFLKKHARVLLKMVNGGIFAELGTVVRTVWGQFFGVACPKDQENHCMRHPFKRIFVFHLFLLSHQVRAEAMASSIFRTSQVPSIFAATEMGRVTSWNPYDIDLVRGWMAEGKTTTGMGKLRPDSSKSGVKKLVARFKSSGDHWGCVLSHAIFHSVQVDDFRAELPTLPLVSVAAKSLGLPPSSTAWRVLHHRLRERSVQSYQSSADLSCCPSPSPGALSLWPKAGRYNGHQITIVLHNVDLSLVPQV